MVSVVDLPWRVAAVRHEEYDENDEDDELAGEIADILKVHEESVLEKLIQQERWNRLKMDIEESESETTATACVYGVTHQPGCAVPDTGCATTLTGETTLKRHEEATSKKVQWKTGVPPVRFKGFDDNVQTSVGAVELEWRLDDKMIIFEVHVVPGDVGLLLSKPIVKALGTQIDLESDEMYLKRVGENVQMTVTPAGHYEVDLRNPRRRSSAKEDIYDEKILKIVNVQQSFHWGRVGAHKPAGW